MQSLNDNINIDLNQYQLNNFQHFTLNTFTANLYFVKFIEHLLATENEEAKHCYHKICINVGLMLNDSEVSSMNHFLELINKLINVHYVPVQYNCNVDEDRPENNYISFYVNSLNFVLKVIGKGFALNIKNVKRLPVRIIFNDKKSIDLFSEKITMEEIVSDAVNKMRNEELELDLSDFCSNKDFSMRKISFYKLSLLAHYKILMLRMGREIKKLNLSNNKLRTFPIDVLNFFKGPLNELNLCYNMLETINDFQLNLQLEILWLEGNPFCDDFTPLNYVKQFVMQCPKLKLLDGIRVNQVGLIFPVWRNFVHENDPILEDLAGRFMEMYFLSFDSEFRRRVHKFYDDNTMVTISTSLEEEDEKAHTGLCCMCRNILHDKCTLAMIADESRKVFMSRSSVVSFLTSVLPKMNHDPATFHVDVVPVFNDAILIIIDGIFRTYRDAKMKIDNVTGYFNFRRSFILKKQDQRFLNKEYFLITNDMLTVSKATQEQIENSFQTRIFNPMQLDLVDATKHQKNLLVYYLSELTETTWQESEMLLSSVNWNIRNALVAFMRSIRSTVNPKPMLTAPSSTSMDPQGLMDIDDLEFDID